MCDAVFIFFSAAELYGFFQMNNSTYLALIFEKDDSFLGREVTLDWLAGICEMTDLQIATSLAPCE